MDNQLQNFAKNYIHCVRQEVLAVRLWHSKYQDAVEKIKPASFWQTAIWMAFFCLLNLSRFTVCATEPMESGCAFLVLRVSAPVRWILGGRHIILACQLEHAEWRIVPIDTCFESPSYKNLKNLYV